MEAAGPRSSERRPRRGSLERPINMRLVRNAALVLVLPLLLAALTVGRPGPLPPPVLPPSFDGDSAAALAEELATEHPSRVPGQPGSAGSLSWLTDKMRSFGLTVETDSWRESVPDLGEVTLRNGVTVIEGDSEQAVVFVAHRDNEGISAGASDNASGTAALVELARFYAAGGPTGEAPRPRQTLIFLSTDGGSVGGLGAARFATTSPYRDRISAVVVLDALSGPGDPRLELAGDGPHSPAAALVRTAAVRLAEELGTEPARPGVIRQLVDLGIPFAYGDQAPFLGQRVSALRITTADDSGDAAQTDTIAELDPVQIGSLGRGAQALLGSLDAGAELARNTSAYVYVGGRVVQGWAIILVLVAALVPFAAGVIDLLMRCRRLGTRLGPAFVGLAGRLLLWLWAGAVLWIAGALGVLPEGPPRPLPPSGASASDWPVAALAGLSLLIAVPWLASRRRPGSARIASPEDELAGYAVGLTALGAVAVLTVPVNAYALVFVLPSLYAWLWLPQVDRPWLRDVLYGIGYAGPVLAFVSLADRFGLGVDVLLYAAGLVTIGYVPWASALLLLAWGATAVHVGTVVSGRYAVRDSGGQPLVARLRAGARALQASRR
jgi:hypothetical protein